MDFLLAGIRTSSLEGVLTGEVRMVVMLRERIKGYVVLSNLDCFVRPERAANIRCVGAVLLFVCPRQVVNEMYLASLICFSRRCPYIQIILRSTRNNTSNVQVQSSKYKQ